MVKRLNFNLRKTTNPRFFLQELYYLWVLILTNWKNC